MPSIGGTNGKSIKGTIIPAEEDQIYLKDKRWSSLKFKGGFNLIGNTCVLIQE